MRTSLTECDVYKKSCRDFKIILENIEGNTRNPHSSLEYIWQQFAHEYQNSGTPATVLYPIVTLVNVKQVIDFLTRCGWYTKKNPALRTDAKSLYEFAYYNINPFNCNDIKDTPTFTNDNLNETINKLSKELELAQALKEAVKNNKNPYEMQESLVLATPYYEAQTHEYYIDPVIQQRQLFPLVSKPEWNEEPHKTEMGTDIGLIFFRGKPDFISLHGRTMTLEQVQYLTYKLLYFLKNQHERK